MGSLLVDLITIITLIPLTLMQKFDKELALKRLIATDRNIEKDIDREMLNRLVTIGFANHYTAFKSVVTQYLSTCTGDNHNEVQS